MDIRGNSSIQIGNGLRTYIVLPPHGNPPRKTGSVNFNSTVQRHRSPFHVGYTGTGNTLEWLPGSLHITPNSIIIKNSRGIQFTSNVMDTVIRAEQTCPATITSQDSLRLTRQVTLTDFCHPSAERPGLPILTLRHPADIVGAAITSTPPGRDPHEIEEAWSALTSTTGGRDSGEGIRASLISLNFLVAARVEDYPDRSAADAVRTHIISNYKDRRIEARLDRLRDCLGIMLRCRVFPHQFFGIFGGLLSWISQDRLASITAISQGVQEVGKTDQTIMPRSTVHVPACTFLDADCELRLNGDGVKFVYLVFVYNQRLGREGVRIQIITSKLNSQAFGDILSCLFHRVWTENAIRGTEGSIAPATDPRARFPLEELTRTPNAPRCTTFQLHDPQATAALYQWTPDLRGRADKNSCLYSAYMRLGILSSDNTRPTRKVERYGGVEVPVVWLEGFKWDPETWIDCYY
ncbi:capsid triplex subunit 1 [Felid alphaherpesvirus 1]|nr:capsid triplex subunit 1 [Felid alphaherpesvirus 1]ALJ84160.1 capsid triplex subunit 1 [Felid alphaherpesvirus 1]ALJ84236.1 capsid triplex subunit 1 [Felid alphaherpesvirus 1]ALJ84312.1 capsid triplex subunit 1 [Felid alphaherpesvirus 1]ALJ84388.1 capsid triplex subunit 1 [Felid alphaherpesvirus 1]